MFGEKAPTNAEVDISEASQEGKRSATEPTGQRTGRLEVTMETHHFCKPRCEAAHSMQWLALAPQITGARTQPKKKLNTLQAWITPGIQNRQNRIHCLRKTQTLHHHSPLSETSAVVETKGLQTIFRAGARSPL